MFGKKKKVIETPKVPVAMTLNYTEWEKDLGFLTFLMTQEIGINKVKWVEMYSKQLFGPMDTIHDSDIIKPVADVTWNILRSLSENYVEFLCTKYFRNPDELLSFIVNTIWMAIAKNASDENAKKLEKARTRENLKKTITKLNKKMDKATKRE